MKIPRRPTSGTKRFEPFRCRLRGTRRVLIPLGRTRERLQGHDGRYPDNDALRNYYYG